MIMKLLCVMVCIVVSCGAADGTTLLTFDDLSPGPDYAIIQNGYGGLQWYYFDVINAPSHGSGYAKGMVSPYNVAFNPYGEPASVSCASLFSLNSAHLTAAFVNGMQVRVTGFAGPTQAYDNTYTLSTTAPILVNFNYTNVDYVLFTPYPSSPFVVDNLEITIGQALPDTNAPTVTSVYPTNGAVGVSMGTAVTVTFSEAMDAATITNGAITLSNAGGMVSGVVSYDPATLKATLTPISALPPSTLHTVVVAGTVADIAGNPISSVYSSTFTTIGQAPPDTNAPTVTSVYPTNGAVGMSVNTAVTVTFSEAMDAATISNGAITLTNAGGVVSGVVTYNPATFKATLTPNSTLSLSTLYTIVVAGTVADIAGNPMGNVYSSSFSVTATSGEVVIHLNWRTLSGPFTVLDGIVGGTSITNLFRALQNGSYVLAWRTNVWYISKKIAGYWTVNLIFQAGDGFFVNAGGPQGTQTDITWTVEGGGPRPPLTLVSNQYYFLGSYTNASATYEDVVGAPPQEGTTLFRHIAGSWYTFPNSTNWQAYNFTGGAWTPATPVLDPLEAAVIVYPTLQLQLAPANSEPQVVLTWPRGKLESTGTAAGPWQEISNAAPQIVVDPSSTPGMRLFRAREDTIEDTIE